MKGRRFVICILVVMVMVFSVACQSESEGQVTPTEDGKIVVNFWHSMGGHNLGILEELINQYNSSQDEVTIKPIYQGSYREGFSKINSVLGTEEVPALMQLNEESTKPMIDMGYIKPMQEFIERDNFDISS